MKTYHHILTIAGSDSCGGAGIEADIKTISALGCYASVAITAVTAQNTLGVRSICKVTPGVVADQIAAVMDDLHPQAIKVGMVNDAETIRAIATTIRRYPLPPMIIDPVMVSTSGSRLMEPDALSLFQATLLPLSTLLTPNIPEAELLAGRPIHGLEDMKAAARQIQRMGRRRCWSREVTGRVGRRRTLLLDRRLVPHLLFRHDFHPQHPWHGLHALLGYRLFCGERAGDLRGRSLCQSLSLRGFAGWS